MSHLILHFHGHFHASKGVILVADKFGIAEKDQRDVFKKFRRIQSQDSPTVKGTGLGLYWAREIIRNHRGKISVYSAGPNRGTTFTIELPVIVAENNRAGSVDTAGGFAEE